MQYLPTMMFLKFVQGNGTANFDIITTVVKPLIISISGVKMNEIISKYYGTYWEHQIS